VLANRHIGAVIFILMSGLTLSLSMSEVSANESSIAIDTRIGFSNTFRPGRWTPITVTISNQGSDFSGYLQVRTRNGDEFHDNVSDIIHQRRLDLTRNSSKRLHFTVMLSNVAHPLLTRVIVDGQEVARQEINLRTQFTADQLLLVVSRDANLDYLNDNAGSGLRIVYPHPQLLPDQWQGYDGVSALILHGVSLEQLSTRQHQALLKWIAQGGTLAVSGGPDYSLLRTPRLTNLLPATPIGMVQMKEPASARDAFGTTLDISAPFHVNRLPASATGITLRAADIPLVAEKSIGRGRVIYLTFDVARAPFDRWPGMQAMWLELLHLDSKPQTQSFIESAAATSSPVPMLIATQGMRFPSHGILLAFLTLYLCILFTGYRLCSSPGMTAGIARWILPFATWASPVIAAPAAYMLFGPVLFDRGISETTITVLEPLADSGYAHAQVNIGIHSNRDGAMQMSYRGMEPVLRVPSASQDVLGSANWTFRKGAQQAITPNDARRYALHLLQGKDVIAYDLRAAIERNASEQGLQLRIDNHSGRPLHDAWLVADDRAWFIGAISSEQAFVYPIDSDGFKLNSTNYEWWDRLDRHPQARASAQDIGTLKSLISRKADTIASGGYPGIGHALVIAHTTRPLQPSGISAQWRHNAQTLVLLRMPAPLLVKDESTVDDL
jgi:hypothetical protein